MKKHTMLMQEKIEKQKKIDLKRKVENEYTKQYEFLLDKYKKIYNDLLILKLDMQKTKQRLIDNMIKYLVTYTIILLFVIYFIISYS